MSAALIAASVVASSSVALTWPAGVNAYGRYHGTVWHRLYGVLRQGSADPLASWAQKNVLSWIGVGRLGAAAVVLCAALAACVVALRPAAASSPHRSGAESPAA